MNRVLRLIARIVVMGVVALAVAAAGAYFGVLDRNLDQGTPPTVTTVAADGFTSAITRGRQRIATTRANAQYPSLSVAVAVDGTAVWYEATGYADLSSRTPATPDTRYPIGSISKPLTAVAALRLEDSGILMLDEGIARYLPELPTQWRAVTMRQLLSHQAGVRHYRFAWRFPTFSENGLNQEFPSVAAGLSVFIDDPALFAPDTSFAYSTFGYSLASRVMEVAAAETFLPLMDRLVFRPIPMSATEPDRSRPSPANRSTDYLAPLSGWGVMRSPETNSSYKWAGGGFVSTPGDLVRFAQALLNGSLLPQTRFMEMTTPRRTVGGAVNAQNYGLGWRSGVMTYPRQTDRTTAIVHHGGTALGSECMLLIVPGHQTVVSICGNANTGGSTGLLSLSAAIASDFLEVSEAARNKVGPNTK